MTPQALWYDDILDALKADAIAIGGRSWQKVVGCMLWPDKTPEAASRLLSDCLNIDRQQRLTPHQMKLIIRKAREVGSLCTITDLCQDANLSVPVPVEPEDEIARLQREVVKAAELFRATVDKLERLSK